MNIGTNISNILFSHPTSQDWARIETKFDWNQLDLAYSDFQLTEDNSLENISGKINLPAWIVHFKNFINFDIKKSYVFMIFYYEQGIPDDKWWSQDADGIKYFTNFEPKHHLIKANFDYYADFFYYKVFSVLDILGQIMNIAFNLKMPIEKVTFYRACTQIKTVNVSIYDSLNLIINENEYRKARKIRDALTHKYSPFEIGPPVSKISANSISLGIGQYTTSTEIKENAACIVELLAKTIQAIKK